MSFLEKKLASSPGIMSVYTGFFSGGARNIHTDLVIELHKRGVHQHVLGYRSSVDRGKEGIQHQEEDENYCRLKANHIGVSTLGLSPTDDFCEPETIRKLAEAIRQNPADTLYALKEQAVEGLVKANQYIEEHYGEKGKPIIVGLHRTDPTIQDPVSFEILKSIESDPAAKKYILGYIACSESAVMAYQHALGLQHEPERFRYVHNGIDHAVFHPRSADEIKTFMARKMPHIDLPENAPVITIGARNNPEKNIDLFIQSACIFLSEHPNAQIILCGSGMTRKNLIPRFRHAMEAMQSQEEILTHIHPIGRISRSDMACLGSITDIVALTSPTLGEADPLVLKEAMSCGAIPVSTCTGDTAHLIGLDKPDQYYLKEIPLPFLPGPRGVLTSQNPVDISHAWEHALTHKAQMQQNVRAFLPEIEKTRMVDSAIAAIEALKQNRKQHFTDRGQTDLPMP